MFDINRNFPDPVRFGRFSGPQHEPASAAVATNPAAGGVALPRLLSRRDPSHKSIRERNRPSRDQEPPKSQVAGQRNAL